MRIAQVAPLCESVPPTGYGGTERVVSWLTEALVELGHEVTLFASGDSVTRAQLVPACPTAIWHDDRCRDVLPHHLRMMELVFDEAARFDIVHFHTEIIAPLLRASPFAHLVGEIGGAAKDHFLGRARALLFPIDWEEPFGLVMIEAMACGTPVIAWRRRRNLVALRSAGS